MVMMSSYEVEHALAEFIIFRAEHLYAEDCIIYTANSPRFEELDHGVEIPMYSLTFEKPEGFIYYTLKGVTRCRE
jgi:hypothetical protein